MGKTITVSDPDFGIMMNCAVRYCIGRQTYMPGLAIGFITPLLSHLDDNTLLCFRRDIQEKLNDERWNDHAFGDPSIDRPKWMEFKSAVDEEIKRRNKIGSINISG